MVTQTRIPPLRHGESLDRAEFHRRYEASPELHKAELIEGRVHMPSPTRNSAHAGPQADTLGWVLTYRQMTPHVQVSDNPTLIIDQRNEFQPDVVVRLDPEYGGRSHANQDDYLEGPPEFVIEIAASSAARDRSVKRRVYERFGVQEFAVWQTIERAFTWWTLKDGRFRQLDVDADGRIESRLFGGLVLDVEALLSRDLETVVSVQQAQAGTAAHDRFVSRMERGAEE